MSGSAALEYGFPSSHSTNAVSVAFYALHKFYSTREEYHPNVFLGLQVLCYWFALSIVFGRLYCGMHGFLDVIIGSMLGVVIAIAQLIYEQSFDNWLFSGSHLPPLVVTLVILVLVRIHPEPADDCPCFDDTVAFVGVVIGINIGAWHYALTGLALDDPIPSTNPFRLETVGLPRATLRILLGVVVIFLWRASMKTALFKILPPVFRLLEHARLNLPRAFFLNASNYTSIPTLRGDDNVIPPASELPHMLKNLAHPRKRSVSVGPQSAADAYETLAYRNRRRRESINSLDGVVQEDAAWSPVEKKPSLQSLRSSSRQREKSPLGVSLLPTPAASRVQSYEQMMGTGNIEKIDVTPPDSDTDFAVQTPAEAETEKREIFMQLLKPRVRYDVEVITKLIIYSGIGYLAVCGNPILFEYVALGTGIRS
ncbi:Long-chain base-1-phosphate phosphatase [Kalmusia sp. IMI 367209]|nr:Long-chain base-1-phosphate phosphatase [Kalmusia sp. IMI 367209]